MDRFRVSSALPKRLEELGGSPAAVLRLAGLPAGFFDQPKIFASTEEFFALYRGISETSRDPAIGLKLGTEERIERYDPVGIAALSARSLRDALQRLARYKQLTCPEKIELLERAGECAVQFLWLKARGSEPELLVDVCFAWVLGIARRGSGGTIEARRVEFQRSAAHPGMYQAHFRCPLEFGARRNALVFGAGDLDRPFLTHNADLLAMVAPQLDAELSERLAQKTIGGRVKGILQRLLAGRRPGIEDVARELHLSARTLQRRLAGEGASFQQLMQEARRALAHHYLLHSSLELNETAYLLGYEDANSFFRAFHRWEGSSPGEWRASRISAAPAPAGAAVSSFGVERA